MAHPGPNPTKNLVDFLVNTLYVINMKSRQGILLPDIHHPEYSSKAFRAALSYIKKNADQIEWVVLMGDNMNCENISRHTKGKPRLRQQGGFQKDLDRFNEDILIPIEQAISKKTKKIFMLGNHEDWLEQWLDENPEFEGSVSFDKCLSLKKRGWEVVPQGSYYRIGKAYVIHGDQIGSGMFVAKKLVDSYCSTAIMGHVHTAAMFTKVSDIKRDDKWIGYTLPTLGTCAPKYAKGRPNAFINGFGIVEVQENDFINVYIPIVFKGKFSYGGEVYDGRS
jgi:UDP-2,3-diacylglucosamine pyrophosphatase LpxH